MLLDGWVLRAAGGYTNRANSATPLDPCRAPIAVQLSRVRILYAALGQPALVRTRSFDDPALLQGLQDSGWIPDGRSTVLSATLHADDESVLGVELFEGKPPEDWRRDHAGLSRADPVKRDRIFAALAIPCAFAGLRSAGPGSPFVACALVGVHDGMACLNLVVTDPAQRRRGLSRRLVAALLAWARSRQGANMASLQVDSNNAPALALYAGLGFDTVLFHYEYWRAPTG